MAPKLYYDPLSGPSRAVLLTAKAIDLKLDEKVISLGAQDQLKEQFLKLNPQHTVPTLDDDGFILWDSHAIMGYLIAKYAKNDDLYPKNDIKKRAIIDQRLHFESGVLFSRGVLIVRPIIRGLTKEIPQEKLDALREGYDFLEKFLEGNKYVAGDSLTIADFSIVTSVTSWEAVIPVDDNYPNIKAWLKRIEALPYFGVNKAGNDVLKNVILKNLSQ